MITAASKAIRKYCRRGFISDTYDELTIRRHEALSVPTKHLGRLRS
jgi:hypothetical protein